MLRVVAISAFSFFYTASSYAKGADCLLEIDGQTIINGQCDYISAGRNFQVSTADQKSRGFINADVNGQRVLSWDSGSQFEPLGGATRFGACWQNARARLCVWKIGEQRYFIGPDGARLTYRPPLPHAYEPTQDFKSQNEAPPAHKMDLLGERKAKTEAGVDCPYPTKENYSLKCARKLQWCTRAGVVISSTLFYFEKNFSRDNALLAFSPSAGMFNAWSAKNRTFIYETVDGIYNDGDYRKEMLSILHEGGKKNIDNLYRVCMEDPDIVIDPW